ncbi:MAG: PilN domain-containing protein [Armatimonadota bacterium]
MIATAGSKRKAPPRGEVLVLGLSAGCVRLLQARAQGGDVVSDRWVSVPAADDETRARAVVDALAGAGVRERRVTVCLPASWLTMKRVQLPPAEPEQIPELVRYEAQRHLPLPLEQLAFGYQVMSHGKPGEGAGTDVLIAVCRKTDLSRLERSLSDAGITVDGYGIEPLGVTDSYLSGAAPFRNGDARLLLAPESAGVHVQVLRGSDLVHSRYVVSNGDDWTGSVRRSLTAFALERPDLHLAEAVALGAEDPERLSLALDRPVSPAAADPTLPAEYLPMLGVARQSLGLGQYPLRIEPQGWQEARAGSERPVALLAVAAAVLVVAGLVGWQLTRVRARAADRREAGRIASLAARDQKALTQLREERDALRAQLTVLGDGETRRPLDLLDDIAGKAPRGLWLTHVGFQAGKPLQLEGTAREATQVTRFLRDLERIPDFGRAELGFLRSENAGEIPVTEFRIDCHFRAGSESETVETTP